MNSNDIIRMAALAGWEMDDSCVLEPQVVWYISQGQLESFAALVYAEGHKDGLDDFEAGVLPAAIKAEREACAKLVYEITSYRGIADAIRARGDALTKLNQAAEDIGEEL